ncbi:hypothetical protein DPEC_G00371070 [Dallia pectoralis]|nr:hypothetical protein DPEC_G00371070 [Dallia pectoralis]
MESTGLEELQLEVIRALCLLPRESLVELCDYLIIAGAEFEHVTKKGRTALITLISNHIQREELEELEDKEKSATELYKQLTSEVQGIKETPQNFFIRTFDLRQKILFASQESESGLQYDPGLVQKMFLHTVLTGLQNDNIRRDLQPYLEQADISDELLLERVNTACAYETERQNKKKLSGQQRPVTIHSVQSSDAPAEKNENPPTQQKPKVSPAVLSQLEEIRSEMALLKDLKAEVSHIRESMQQPQHMPRQLPPAGGGDGASGLQFSGQQVQDPAQGYWFTGGPGHRGGTAQYQQRFAPQPSFPL